MNYEIGDTVVHWTHGLGTVISIDEMHLAGVTRQYYVVKVDLLKLWVPVEEANGGSIRFPTDSTQFKMLFDILRTPGERLPDQQYKRKTELRERMQKRTLEGLCHVIRDLRDRKRTHTLNQYDASVLFRAEELLLDEWVVALGADRPNALLELEVLLGKDIEQGVGFIEVTGPRRSPQKL
jgi:RNA polymerase-interacting CarD/CdnL/TRCF family regulator